MGGSHSTMVPGHKGKGEGAKSAQAWRPQLKRKQEKGRVVSPVGWQASAACLAMGGLWMARAVMERRRARRKRMAEGVGQSADGEGQDMLLALQSCLWLERQHGSRGPATVFLHGGEHIASPFLSSSCCPAFSKPRKMGPGWPSFLLLPEPHRPHRPRACARAVARHRSWAGGSS